MPDSRPNEIARQLDLSVRRLNAALAVLAHYTKGCVSVEQVAPPRPLRGVVYLDEVNAALKGNGSGYQAEIAPDGRVTLKEV